MPSAKTLIRFFPDYCCDSPFWLHFEDVSEDLFDGHYCIPYSYLNLSAVLEAEVRDWHHRWEMMPSDEDSWSADQIREAEQIQKQFHTLYRSVRAELTQYEVVLIDS